MEVQEISGLNPEYIMLNFTLPGYERMSSIPFKALDDYMNYMITWGIIYGVGVGTALLTLALLWIIIKNKKTPMFWLNQCSLLLLVIRCLLQFAYLLGPLSRMGFSFTGILIPNTYYSYKTTVATNVIHTLLIGLIEASFCYQVFIIFRSPEVRKLGYALTGVCAAIGITVFGLYINSTISVAKTYSDLFNHSRTVRRVGSWVNNGPFILFSVSVSVTSIFLIIKLLFAIKTRRYLGLKQFSILHILLIVSTQTLFVPSILVIINYKNLNLNSTTLSALSIILVVIFLPLSSMWASSANNSPIPSSSTSSILYKSSSNSSSTSKSTNTTYFSRGEGSDVYSLFPQKLSKAGDLEKEFPNKSTILNDNDSFLSKKLQDFEANFKTSPATLIGADAVAQRALEDIDRALNEEEKIAVMKSASSPDRELTNLLDDDYKVVTSHTKS